NRLVASHLLRTGEPAAWEVLESQEGDIEPSLIPFVLIATTRSRGEAVAFERFSPLYLSRPNGRTKEATRTRERSEAISEALMILHQRKAHHLLRGRYYYDELLELDGEDVFDPAEVKDVRIDPRWLGAAMEIEDRRLVVSLATEPDPKVWKLLGQWMDDELGGKANKHWLGSNSLVNAMKRVEHPELISRYLALVEQAAKSKHYWQAYQTYQLMRELPAEAIESLEDWVPRIPDGHLDYFVACLDGLKQQQKSLES
ncbi:MAG: hypothetical protein KDA83_06865, partial [Planctomycetales bacterium]|nr:hypothetical protein [Planctomycetales bacterium]